MDFNTGAIMSVLPIFSEQEISKRLYSAASKVRFHLCLQNHMKTGCGKKKIDIK